MGIGLDKDMLRMWVRHKDPNRSVLLGMWGPGVAPKGDKTDDMLPMNPEGDEVDASQGVGVSTTTHAKPLATCCLYFLRIRIFTTHSKSRCSGFCEHSSTLSITFVKQLAV